MSYRAWFLVPAVAAGLFAGCAADQGPVPGSVDVSRFTDRAGRRAGLPTDARARPRADDGGGSGMGMGGDPSRMCAAYRELTAGKPAVEGEAAVHAQMQAMHGGTLTPEQLRMRREEMERRCSTATERR